MNRLPRRRWPSLTQPRTPLLSTTVVTGIRYCAAVRSALIVIATAVAAHCHAVALRRRELRAEGGRERVSHTADRRGLVDGAGTVRLEVVRHVKAVGARVHGHQRALAQPRGELADHPLRTERHVGRALFRLGEVAMQGLELGEVLPATSCRLTVRGREARLHL